MDKKLRRNISRRNLEHRHITGAGALIFCPATQRYLFLLRNGDRHDGSWGLAGGKVEPDESVTQALFREIHEEIGHDLSDHKTVPLEKFTSDTSRFVYHTFVVVVDTEFCPELNSEHRGYCWVSLHDYPRPLHPGVWRTFNFQSVVDKLRTLEQAL